MSNWVRTIDSDEPGDDEPMEVFTSKKRKRSKKGKATMKATGPVMPVLNQEPTEPVYNLGDPTEQEVIDNVRNLPDRRRGGKVRNHF